MSTSDKSTSEITPLAPLGERGRGKGAEGAVVAVHTAYPDTYSSVKDYSRTNRSCPTDAEVVLWQSIRNRALGVRFRRQHIVGDYIADFICLELKLIIEVDGGYHNEIKTKEEDLIRSEWLFKMGYYVLRFTNEQVLYDTSFVIERINEIINDLKAPSTYKVIE